MQSTVYRVAGDSAISKRGLIVAGLKVDCRPVRGGGQHNEAKASRFQQLESRWLALHAFGAVRRIANIETAEGFSLRTYPA